VILVRPFTEADDVARFHAAKGILTVEGGKVSHAALVARGMGVPAVTGAAIAVDSRLGELRINGRVFRQGDPLGIDGTDRAVVEAGAALVKVSPDARFNELLLWADDIRRIGVRANADYPRMLCARGSSAQRGSACAGPSTCSCPRSVSRGCAR
jgi:pyruvate,orthophosphate dikinase